MRSGIAKRAGSVDSEEVFAVEDELRDRLAHVVERPVPALLRQPLGEIGAAIGDRAPSRCAHIEGCGSGRKRSSGGIQRARNLRSWQMPFPHIGGAMSGNVPGDEIERLPGRRPPRNEGLLWTLSQRPEPRCWRVFHSSMPSRMCSGWCTGSAGPSSRTSRFESVTMVAILDDPIPVRIEARHLQVDPDQIVAVHCHAAVRMEAGMAALLRTEGDSPAPGAAPASVSERRPVSIGTRRRAALSRAPGVRRMRARGSECPRTRAPRREERPGRSGSRARRALRPFPRCSAPSPALRPSSPSPG